MRTFALLLGKYCHCHIIITFVIRMLLRLTKELRSLVTSVRRLVANARAVSEKAMDVSHEIWSKVASKKQHCIISKF